MALPSGSNSAGRVSASQAECRGFESVSRSPTPRFRLVRTPWSGCSLVSGPAPRVNEVAAAHGGSRDGGPAFRNRAASGRRRNDPSSPELDGSPPGMGHATLPPPISGRRTDLVVPEARAALLHATPVGKPRPTREPDPSGRRPAVCVPMEGAHARDRPGLGMLTCRHRRVRPAGRVRGRMDHHRGAGADHHGAAADCPRSGRRRPSSATTAPSTHAQGAHAAPGRPRRCAVRRCSGLPTLVRCRSVNARRPHGVAADAPDPAHCAGPGDATITCQHGLRHRPALERRQAKTGLFGCSMARCTLSDGSVVQRGWPARTITNDGGTWVGPEVHRRRHQRHRGLDHRLVRRDGARTRD